MIFVVVNLHKFAVWFYLVTRGSERSIIHLWLYNPSPAHSKLKTKQNNYLYIPYQARSLPSHRKIHLQSNLLQNPDINKQKMLLNLSHSDIHGGVHYPVLLVIYKIKGVKQIPKVLILSERGVGRFEVKCLNLTSCFPQLSVYHYSKFLLHNQLIHNWYIYKKLRSFWQS